MSELAQEVAAGLTKTAPQLTWFQRVGLIVFANVVSLLLVSVLLAAGSMLWSKAMSTDDIREEVADADARIEKKFDEALAKNRAESQTILSAVAEMSAENKKVVELVNTMRGSVDLGQLLPPLPQDQPEVPPIPLAPEVPEPSASAVREERAQMQREIDEALYRAKRR